MILKNLKDLVQDKAQLGHLRSKDWPKVRREYLMGFPTCALCGGKDTLEVHHIEAFHINPAKELDPNNLITLCESKKHGVTCHLFFGHLGNYRTINPDVIPDTQLWSGKLKKS